MKKYLVAAAAGLIAVCATVVAAPEATANVTYLCTGYDGCRAAGLTDSGYQSQSGTSFWRMAPGHNCTNYVAFRIAQNGGPGSRPWAMNYGNAEDWGPGARSVGIAIDDVPTVGSVGWYAGNHVLYVEQVISNDEIIVSEDNWGGDFHWKRITRGAGWPTGFIHIHDGGTGVPQVTATAMTDTQRMADATLNSTQAGWYPKGSVITLLCWKHGQAVKGYFSPWIPGGWDDLWYLASDGYWVGDVDIETRSQNPVTPPCPLAFASAPDPGISGSVAVGQTLTAVPGGWSPDASLSYQWKANGVDIVGGTGPAWTIPASQLGASLSVTVTGSRLAYTPISRTSAPTAPVALGQFTSAPDPIILGCFGVGMTLEADGVDAWTPAPTVVRYKWFRDASPIRGATSPTYRVKPRDRGHSLQVRLTGSLPGYEAASRMSAPVIPGPRPTGCG